MAIAQMVVLAHNPAPAGMVAEPFGQTQIDPTDKEVADAIKAMNNDRFMVVLSTRMDLDVLFDPDALTIEFGAGHGYLIYQQAFTTQIGANAWRSRSAENVTAPNNLDLRTVLKIVDAYRHGRGFDEIARKFPEV